MVSGRAFMFHIYIPQGKTLSLVPKSRSSVKVICQGHISGSQFKKKNGHCGGIWVSQIHLVVIYCSLTPSPIAQSVAWGPDWRTGDCWFDPQLGQYSFRGLMIVIATGSIPLSP